MKVKSAERFKWYFVIFIIALVIPASLISYQAYQQLRFEALYKTQLEATDLVTKINERIVLMMESESKITDSAYSYWQFDQQNQNLKQSALSKFPVESNLPGIIGYFQVDTNGRLSSPLLPVTNAQDQNDFSMIKHYAERLDLLNEISRVLSENQLLDDASLLAIGQSQTANNDNKEKRKRRKVEINEPENPQSEIIDFEFIDSAAQLEEDDEEYSSRARLESVQAASGKMDGLFVEKKMPAPMSDAGIVKKSDNNRQDKTKPRGFAQLQSQQVQKQIAEEIQQVQQAVPRPLKVNHLTEFEPLKMEKELKAVSSKTKLRKPTDNSTDAPPVEKRLEKSYIANRVSSSDLEDVLSENSSNAILNAVPASTGELIMGELDLGRPFSIDLFESQVEPFRFSLLKSGHLVLYRQVFREKSKFIQGALFNKEIFFQGIVENVFVAAPLSKYTQLSIDLDNNYLNFFASDKNNGTKFWGADIAALELLSVGLAEPLNQLNLKFWLQDIPLGAGVDFIVFSLISLILLLVLGSWFLYRVLLEQSQLNQRQEDFVSAISHELKTPITSIKMYGEMLLQGWMDEEKKKQYYHYIFSESDRLSRLVNNVLQISKVNRQGLEIVPQHYTIENLCAQIDAKIASFVKASGFELKIENQSPVGCKVNIDLDAFIQIIINLVDNAIKYSLHSQIQRIDVSFVSSDEIVEISVRDYGDGIPKNEQARIFEMFYRIGDELTRKAKGTGIGLALVKELADLIDGYITVKNEEPGAKFSLSIPLIKD